MSRQLKSCDCPVAKSGGGLQWLSTFALALTLASLVAAPAWAAWGVGGNGVPVSTSPTPSASDIQTLPDGTGGAYVLWSYLRNGTMAVYLQHLTGNGRISPGWPTAGLAVSGGSGDQTAARMCADGSGGVFVCWQGGVWAAPKIGPDIYAKRITSAGALVTGWPAGGALVCTAQYDQSNPQIVADGAGNAVIAWLDNRCLDSNPSGFPMTPAIYLQKIRGTDGGAMWPGNNSQPSCDPTDGPLSWLADGVRPHGALGVDALFSLTTDGAGGAVLAWSRLGPNLAHNTYIRRVKTSGSSVTFEWDPSPYATYPDAPTPHAYAAWAPLIQRNGTSGYHLVYMDETSDLGNIVYERLDANGGGGPITVCSANGRQVPGNMVPDGSGGVVIGWYDERDGGQCIYAQRVLANQQLATCWPTNGRLIAAGVGAVPSSQPRIAMAGDGRGGAALVFPRGGDLFAMRVQETGSLDPAYGPGGLPVSTANGYEYAPSVAPIQPGKLITAWGDTRNNSVGVYANEHVYSLPALTSAVSALDIQARCRHTILLNWLGPNDSPTYGSVTQFDIRSSRLPITNTNFDACDQVGFYPANGIPGYSYCGSIANLTQCSPYYFAIRVQYSCGQSSLATMSPATSTQCSGFECFCGDGLALSPAVDEGPGVPLSLSLGRVQPNPVLDRAMIGFDVPANMQGAALRLTLFDVSGRRVRELADGPAVAGSHELELSVQEPGSVLRPGTYFLRLAVGREVRTRTILLKH